jgi:hypothetical protein
MKKAIAIILSSFYLLLSIGATVDVHYCGGKVSSVKVYASSHDCCCAKVSKSEMMDCCKDESTLVQLDGEQFQPSNSTIEVDFITLLSSINNNFQCIELSHDENEFETHNLPPPSNVRKYITNVSLTYYG